MSFCLSFVVWSKIVGEESYRQTVRKIVKNTVSVIKLFECFVPLFPHLANWGQYKYL